MITPPKTPTAAELAERLGVARTTIYAWISGTRLSPEAMAKVEDELGIPMRDWAEPDDTAETE